VECNILIRLYIVELVKGRKYLFSTNGAKYYHPDKSVISKIILNDKNIHKELYFNYDFDFINIINKKDLKDKYNYSVHRNTTKIEVGKENE
jgi:hypothetical protein